jgi:tetratricopeptide (TPR) repeat protein
MQSDLVPVLLILLAGSAVYANTLHVPWYFDDFPNIVKNPLISDLAGRLRNIISFRGVGTATFSLNYHFHALSLPGYHLVNIFIHLAASVTVFSILKRLFTDSLAFPFLGGLIFALHPIQTQAVTYVVQRYASLAGLFLFLSFYCFIKAREAIANNRFFSLRHTLFYTLMLIFGAAAVLTKENTIVLPLLIILYDRYFIKESSWCKLSPYVMPFVVGGALFGLSQLLLPYLGGGHSIRALTATAGVFKEPDISPLFYFVTQFTVLWKYIRLLFLPYGQTLDYSLPLTTELFALKNMIAGLGLLLLALAAFWGRNRFRLASFGIFWFFCTLAVESSFIPLDTMFEHRLYIPMFGFVLVVLEIASRIPDKRFSVAGLALLAFILAGLAWQRNNLWGNPIAFTEDNIRKAPQNNRAYISLSKYYLNAGRLDDAQRVLIKYIESDQFNHVAYSNMGIIYYRQGKLALATDMFKKAIGIDPKYEEAYATLGLIYNDLRRWKEGEMNLRKALELLPNDSLAHYNLGVNLYNQGFKAGAKGEFLAASRLKPDDPDALFNLALTSIELGDRDTATGIVPRLESIDRELAGRLKQELVGKQNNNH